MSPRMTIFGEVYESDAEKIVEIAERAAQKRGYVTYKDYNEYIKPRIEGAVASGAQIGREQMKEIMLIKETLVAHGWVFRQGNHNQTRFYPPGTDFSKGQIYFEPFRT